MTLRKGSYFGGAVNISPEFALAQQGELWSVTHRELAIADNGSLDLLLDVKSSFVGAVELTATGKCLYDFVAVGSYTIGAGGSCDVWNRNTFFQAVTSGNITTEFIHTASYELIASRVSGLVHGGERMFAAGGSPKGNVILGPGKYALQIQNKSGGAADVMIQFTFAEPAIPA